MFGSEFKDANSNVKLKVSGLKKLVRYLYPYKYMLLGVVISLLITSACVLAVSQGVKFFIDTGISKRDSFSIDQGLLFLFAIVVTLAIFTFVRFFLITLVGERVVADLRHDIFKHMLNLSPSYFDKNRIGELLSRLTADTTLLLNIIGSSLSVAMRNSVMLIGGIIVLIATSPKLASMLLILIPAVVGPIMIMGRKLKDYSKNSQDRVADLTTHFEQTLSALKVVQSYQRESYENQHFSAMLSAQLKAATDRISLRAFLTAIVISLVFGGIITVLWAGAHQVITGAISAGELSAFVYVSIVCAGSVAALSDTLGDLQKAIGATERIFEFLSIKPTVTEKKGAKSVSRDVKGKIELKNVSFSYDSASERNALNKVSFVVEPGKVTALVGRSGAGKSTLFYLLERFYDVGAGKITVDGLDIRDVKLSNLRSLFTYVPQEPFIFADTVKENILYGRPGASDDEVYNAAKQAGCLEFIEKMPKKFDTYLGEKGSKLSGGQKQRIAIARAILNDPKILLLDEATSSLDSENEKLIQKALNNLMKGRTTIVIAHRFSTVMNADKIIVLNEGEIVETGRHKDLIKNKDGLYQRLSSLQFNHDEER